MSKIGIVIVDAQQLIRAGFSLILQAQDDLRVLGEGSSTADAVALVERHRPDVVLVASTLADGDGFAATERAISRTCPGSVEPRRPMPVSYLT